MYIAQDASVSVTGNLKEMLYSAIYAIWVRDKPLVIFVESGDFDTGALLQLKKLYNSLELSCGYYMMG